MIESRNQSNQIGIKIKETKGKGIERVLDGEFSRVSEKGFDSD